VGRRFQVGKVCYFINLVEDSMLTSLVPVPTGLFIDNKFVPAQNNATINVENPATRKGLGSISLAQKADVDKAVQAAKLAFETTWNKVNPAKRGELLIRLAQLIERDVDELASLEAVDGGILFNDAKNLHVPQVAETLRYFAGWADKVTGQTLEIPNGVAYTRREPLGVCAAIIPWNAPL